MEKKDFEKELDPFLSMAEGWGDLESVLTNLRHNTVLQLQQIIKGLSENGIASLTKTGRKQELIDRIVAVVQDIQRDGRLDKWQKARNILTSRNRPEPKLGDPIHPTYAYNTYPSVSTPTSSTWSTGPRPYVPALSHAPSYQPPKWKYSPFYQIEEAVSSVQECPESTNSQDRKTSKLNFTLKNEHLTKLANRPPRYQLRLYCTSSQYYIPNGTAFRAAVCPIEFPPTCEVRINTQPLGTNFRGIKKKPGTAPPADITTLTKRGTAGMFNQVEMVYVNSAQTVAGKRPPPPQKYYLVVNLVKITSVDELVQALQNRVEPKEAAIDKIRRDTEQNAMEGIELSFTKLTLRDPLTYARLKHPCRSTSCTHWQCFDAQSWYAMNEQTTTWLCPVCDKTLNVEELVLDGYVLDILRHVPEEVDDVLVEPDGEWHTADAAYGSPTWMEQHTQTPDSRPPPAVARQMELAGKSNSQVWDLDDSDSDGERFVKREVLDSKVAFSSSPPPATTSTAPTSVASSRVNSRDVGNIIDLTLDSDDEDIPHAPPPPPLSQSQPHPQRGRVSSTVRRDDPPPLQAPRHRRVETTPLPVLQRPPPNVPPLRVSTGPPSLMQPLQPPTGSMLGKRRNRESDDDLRYRSPDEREREYEREERDYRYSHKAPRRENGDRSPPPPVYSPSSRILPSMNSERRTNGTSSNGYHNSSSSSSAFAHSHSRPPTSLPPIQPRSSSTYRYGSTFARSPESSQSPTLPSPSVLPYYNNPSAAPPLNDSYRAGPPLPARSNSGGYGGRWDSQRRSWD